MCDVYREAYFSPNITNWLNVEKTVHGVETYWLPDKEKVPGAAVNKEGHAVSLLEQ